MGIPAGEKKERGKFGSIVSITTTGDGDDDDELDDDDEKSSGARICQVPSSFGEKRTEGFLTC